VGDYDSPDGQNSSQTGRARYELIETVKRVYPEFLRKLSSDVFPLFERLLKSGQLAKKGISFEHALFSKSPRLLPFGLLAPENGLEAALRQWAKKFNAEEDWIFVNALRTLWFWRNNPKNREALNWTPLWFSGGAPAVGKRFKFSHPGWETRLFKWDTYRDMVRQELDKKLSQYEQQTRILVQSQRLVRTRRQYSPKNIEWFVLKRLAGMSSTKIANQDDMHPDDSTVLRGVKAAEELLGWPPRTRTARNRKTG